MNIVYLYGNSIDAQKGGIQRVTCVLSDYFTSKGHTVYYISRMINGTRINDFRQNYLPNSEKVVSNENIKYLQQFIKENNIDFVINQSGMDPVISELAYSVRPTKAKLFSCIHNSMLASIQHFDTTYEIKAKKYGLKKLLPLTRSKVVKDFLLKLYKFKYASHYQKLCANSDKVILLSEKFKEELSFYLKKNDPMNNVIGLANPTSFKKEIELGFVKKKQLLYVGRIDTRQKKVDLLLVVWGKLCRDFPDWNLKIVGGGIELESLKQSAITKEIINVSFEGFQDPKPYYMESSIFCMTSSYEGFGIVLVEAMQYAVIPFAFDSYLSASDIIDNSVNGFLISPFSIEEYVNKLRLLMSNSSLIVEMGNAAIQKSNCFTLEIIGDKWLDLMLDNLKTFNS